MTSGNETIPEPSRRMMRQAAAASEAARRSRRPLQAPRPSGRWSRRRNVLGVFAAVAAVGFVAAYIVPVGVALSHADAANAAPVTLYASTADAAQTLVVAGAKASGATPSLDRGGYSVAVNAKPQVSGSAATSKSAAWAPPFVSPNPGTAQAIAYRMVKARGWSDADFSCLVALWNRESGWRVNAYNAGSGAYGIPQALPGSKMGSVAPDWATNPATQITWGLNYVGGRYGTPCGAWNHSNATGWY